MYNWFTYLFHLSSFYKQGLWASDWCLNTVLSDDKYSSCELNPDCLPSKLFLLTQVSRHLWFLEGLQMNGIWNECDFGKVWRYLWDFHHRSIRYSCSKMAWEVFPAELFIQISPSSFPVQGSQFCRGNSTQDSWSWTTKYQFSSQ